VFGPFDSVPHFSGPTQTRKTSLARIAAAHFSQHGDLIVKTAAWSATAKSLQRQVFQCRDSLLVVDELTGQQQVETATIVVQGQGNLSVGTALTGDRQLAAIFDPRGSILSTGETDPRRQSTLARMVAVRFTAETVDLRVLTRLQKHARDGLFALAMSGFIKWLAAPGKLAEKKLAI
jgi:hypothetical protein